MKDLLHNEVLVGDRVRFSPDGSWCFGTYGIVKEISINEGCEMAHIWVEGTDGEMLSYRSGPNFIQVSHRVRGN